MIIVFFSALVGWSVGWSSWFGLDMGWLSDIFSGIMGIECDAFYI